MTEDLIRKVLKYIVIAVVGLSKDPDKDSNKVSLYLKKNGYRIIPVNPFALEVLGDRSYPTLLDMPPEVQKTIDIVCIFRPSIDVPPIIEQTIKLKEKYGKPSVVWMQLGIINTQSAEKAQQVGLTVIMDKCLMVEHRRFAQGLIEHY